MNEEMQTNGLTVEQELERYKRWLWDRNQTIKELTTPPTVEEVCEALSEFHSNKNYVSKFYYDNENKKFYNECIIMHKSGGLTRNIYLTNDGVVLGVDGLTLDLITLIGRFYGGIDKNE